MVVNLPAVQNEEDDIHALEIIVLNYYAENYDALLEDEDDDSCSADDDDDDDNDE